MLMFAFIELCYRLLLTAIGIAIASLFTLTGIVLLIIGIIKKIKYNGAVRSKKKKYPTVLIALGSVLVSIPLVVVGTIVTNSIVHYVALTKKLTTEDRCEIVIEAAQNKEKEPIKELFCEIAQNTINLDTELDGFFNFIDGNIVSYDKPRDGPEGLSSTHEDGLVDKHSGGRIYSILTDTGNVYTIYIYSYDVYKKDPRFVGMTMLSITDEKRYNEENNYPEDSFYKIDIDCYPD